MAMGKCMDCERCTASAAERFGRAVVAVGSLGVSEAVVGVANAFKRICPTCGHPLAQHEGARVRIVNPTPPAPIAIAIHTVSHRAGRERPVLLDCAACANKVSSMAQSCPTCGHPMIARLANPVAAAAELPRSEDSGVQKVEVTAEAPLMSTGASKDHDAQKRSSDAVKPSQPSVPAVASEPTVRSDEQVAFLIASLTCLLALLAAASVGLAACAIVVVLGALGWILYMTMRNPTSR